MRRNIGALRSEVHYVNMQGFLQAFSSGILLFDGLVLKWTDLERSLNEAKHTRLDTGRLKTKCPDKNLELIVPVTLE